MKVEIALQEIDDFLAKSIFPNAISFFGGEPLLAFPLIQEIVHYSEEVAQKLGKTLVFGLTTNGTLFNIDILHFLLKHNFRVIISLDGPREVHNLYRKFAFSENSSFDQIIKYFDFFQKYASEGHFACTATLAPPIHFKERNHFFRDIYETLPLISCNFLRKTYQCPSKPHSCSIYFNRYQI
jgi:uncharacterized protein